MDIRTKLCYYDTRNPNGIVSDVEIDEDVGPYKKAACNCDNCFYGRTELAEHALMLEETLAGITY